MSDKLNKFSFLAGKLFARTVNEVKPILTTDEPPKTDPTPTLSPEEKIKKVLELLESKNVSKNIENLLNRYDYESDEIIFKRGYFNSVSPKEAYGLNNELVKELEIEKIEKYLYFKYKEKSLKILLTNNRSGSLSDGDLYNFYDLIVLYKDICVLKDSISKVHSTNGSNYSVGKFFSMKSFKNGGWIDDLDYLNKSFDEYEKNKKLRQEYEKEKKLAEKLDLDPLD